MSEVPRDDKSSQRSDEFQGLLSLSDDASNILADELKIAPEERETEQHRNEMVTMLKEIANKRNEMKYGNDFSKWFSKWLDEQRRKRSEPVESDFDKFVSRWPNKRPPRQELIKLAEQLCDEAHHLPRGQEGASKSINAPDSKGKQVGGDGPTVCRVSWDGVSPDWFIDVFMKTPEVQQFLRFGCRMWFIRGFGIKEMLQRRGVFSGPFVDHIDMFFPMDQEPGRETKPDEIQESGSQATAFISFTGFYTLEHFAELVGHDDLRGRYLWIDTFCVDQFAWTERKDNEMIQFKKNFMHELREKIGRIGFTALMLDQWDDLMSTLGQIWVIWEMFSTADSEVELKVLFRGSEHDRFVQEGLGGEIGFSNISKAMSTIDSRKAGSSQIEDKTLILEIMEGTGGVIQVNTQVCECMRDWLVNTGRAYLEKRRKLGHSVLGLANNMAALLSEQGKLDEAEPLKREELNACRVQLGDKHPNTLTSINNLANLLRDQGKLAEAEPLYREVLNVRRDQLGDKHPNTLTSVNNLAALLSDEGNLVEAEPLYLEALTWQRELLGNKHPDTLSSTNNLAILLHNQGKLDEAEPLYREAINGYRKQLGDKHPDTLRSINNLANLLCNQGKHDESEPLYHEALNGQREQLGDKHPDTLRSVNNLANLLCNQGKYDEAEPFHREALNGQREQLGDKHPDTLVAIYNMGAFLVDRGKFCQAVALFEEAQMGFNAVLGADHMYRFKVRDALNIARSISLEYSLIALFCLLGVMMSARGEFSHAVALLEEAQNGFLAMLGAEHTDTKNTAKALGNARQHLMEDTSTALVEWSSGLR